MVQVRSEQIVKSVILRAFKDIEEELKNGTRRRASAPLPEGTSWITEKRHGILQDDSIPMAPVAVRFVCVCLRSKSRNPQPGLELQM